MCLFVKDDFIAKEPIIAYKVIESRCKVYSYLDGDVSLFRLYPIEYDKEETSEITVSNYYGLPDVVERGLHLFIHLKDALEMIREYSNLHVIKCIIPKGARVYKGVTGAMHLTTGSWDNVPSYAVNRVTYLKGYLDEL